MPTSGWAAELGSADHEGLAVLGLAVESGLALRGAAMVLAVRTVAEAHRLRGLYP